MDGTRRALICGISGQDGAYLARLLLDKDYEVIGTGRRVEGRRFGNLEFVEARERVVLRPMDVTDHRDVLRVVEAVHPHEIYNLAGQSSVGLSFEEPLETMRSIILGNMHLLEAIRSVEKSIRYFSAGSGECFGDTGSIPADETTPFRPRSPYAVGKASAFWQVANYREAYDLFACTGILFNHESPLRPERFVTRKIVSAACRIAAGMQEKLDLGDISIVRDWGWAPEYVEVMWRMLQRESPGDFVIATGESSSLKDFVEATFAHLGLDWAQHVTIARRLLRPSEIMISNANVSRAEELLGWKARHKMRDVVRLLVDSERRR